MQHEAHHTYFYKYERREPCLDGAMVYIVIDLNTIVSTSGWYAFAEVYR